MGSDTAKKVEAAPAAKAPARAVPDEAQRAERIAKRKADVAARERKVLAPLVRRFGAAILGEVTHEGRLFVSIAPDEIVEVLRFLKEDPALRFELFLDVTCADYLRLPELGPKRFGLLYVLYSEHLDAYVRLRVFVNAGEARVKTGTTVFTGMNWGEREVYDLYGIVFDGHPDLRRILLPDDYDGHPLRKDYPLKGRGERDRFPVITRRES